ncbi:unnamed protein product [Notodromas monacha]|uniref:Uncharacterized protein n=1 Tax=Notodromas monacha TaxID=399045 RepID=A0A7R9GBS6_9CRUS|nr:unnamed protein product [Notodromas monacha]CAG0915292.1 unnamed protein product [Notodromas monacha]
MMGNKPAVLSLLSLLLLMLMLVVAFGRAAQIPVASAGTYNYSGYNNHYNNPLLTFRDPPVVENGSFRYTRNLLYCTQIFEKLFKDFIYAKMTLLEAEHPAKVAAINEVLVKRKIELDQIMRTCWVTVLGCASIILLVLPGVIVQGEGAAAAGPTMPTTGYMNEEWPLYYSSVALQCSSIFEGFLQEFVRETQYGMDAAAQATNQVASAALGTGGAKE